MYALRWLDGWIEANPVGIGVVLVVVWLTGIVVLGLTVGFGMTLVTFGFAYWLAVAVVSALTE